MLKKLPDGEQAEVRRYLSRKHVPNRTTRKVLREATSGEGRVRCKDAEHLFAQLKI
jgi:hypothetical protein